MKYDTLNGNFSWSIERPFSASIKFHETESFKWDNNY